jgi:Fe-S-cluster-containing hydrogenase component 2
LIRIKVNNELCVGCHVCELICSLQQTGEFNLKRSAIRISFDGLSPAKIQVCQQCPKAPCVKACPENALSQSEGVVHLERSNCCGCGECTSVCPYHAIFLDSSDDLALKCNLCNGSPVCVAFCPKEALFLEKKEV